jgi:DNA-binding NtrC family response regulator
MFCTKHPKGGEEMRLSQGSWVRSATMRKALDELERVAGDRRPLLLTGEPGVGKRFWARAVHTATGGGLLQVVDGASVRAEEWAAIETQGGTLLVVELGKLPEAQQGRLLTLLEAGRIQLLATSSEGERQGLGHYIRPDLFFRLIRCALPPLRERREDLEELTDQFLAQHGGEGRPRLAKEAIGALLLYEWPGNVAELEAVLLRALRLVIEDMIGPGQLPLAVAGYLLPPPPRPLFKRYIRSAELLLIRWALRENKNDRTRAAKWLGISRAALYKKLKLYPEFGTGAGA